MYKGPAACAREAKVVKGMGFNAYKMRLAGGMQQDIEAVRAVRQAVGADFHIMVEAHSWWQLGDRSYPPDSVARIATEMGYYNVTWLEDPLPPEDRTAYRQLADMRLVPLAAGERERDLSDLLSLAEGEAVDCIHTNAISQGGYQGCRRIIEVAAKHGKQFAIHCMGTRLETAIEVHLGVCYPKETVGWLEYPLFQEDGRTFTYSFPLASEILKEPLDIKNGVLLAPWGQGLGVEVNEAVVERYPYIPGPWSVMRLTTEP
jgi:L-alanine-DL-glutamate epimerase-like enolase superfamily enzyme